MLRSISFAFLALSISSPWASAQDVAAPVVLTSFAGASGGVVPSIEALAATSLHIDPSRVHYDEQGDGQVFARGVDYKAGFGPRGVTYYPLFGPDHPHAPHALAVASLTIDGAAVELERGACARRIGDRIELDRGPFREVYDLQPKSVEQSFVFDSLPRTGEIVVRIPISSSLEASETDQAIEFHGPGGRVTYSRAIVLDGAGRRADAPTALVDGSIEIRVDATFAASARMPLVIDPVITTFTAFAAQPFYASDMAVNPSNGIWLIAYSIPASFNDQDIYAVTLNPDGSVRTSGYVDLSPNSWMRPRVAAGSRDQFLIVAHVDEFLQVVNIRARRVTGSTFTVSPEIMVSEFSEGACRNASVGGDSSAGGPTNNVYCVLYERRLAGGATEITHRRVSNSTVTPPVLVATTPAGIEPFPEISRSSVGFIWLAVWRDAGLAAGTSTIQARRIHAIGTLLGPAFAVSSGSTLERSPSVSSALIHPAGTATFLVATELDTAGDKDVQLAVVRDDAVLQTVNLSAALGLGGNQSLPAVDANSAHYTVVYQQSQSGQVDIRATELAFTDGYLSILQAHESFGALSSIGTFPRVAAYQHHAPFSGAPDVRWAVTWENGASSVRGGIFEGLRGGPKIPFCLGDGSGTACPCGNSSAPGSESGCTNSFGTAGRLVATGDASTHIDTLVLAVSGLPPTGNPPTFFQGTLAANGGAGAVFGDGLRCAVGSVLRLGSPPSSGGSASLGYGVPGTDLVSIRGAIPSSGGTRFYQVLYRNLASFCTSATFNATNGLSVVWAL